MRPVDLALASAGRSYATLHRRRRWLPAAAVAGLVLLSLIPVLIVGSTKQPTDISLADLQANRLPAATSWFRVEGELREAEGGIGADHAYTLHDSGDDQRAATIYSSAPLPTGHVELTGHQSGSPVRGTFIAMQADVPTEPARHDPWLLFAIPALLAVPIVAGWALGYPVMRRDRPARTEAAALAPGERFTARWGGWVGNERVDLADVVPCSIEVDCDADVCRMTITDANGVRTVPHRRASPKKRMRLCWTNRCEPGLELHASAADLVLVFDDAATRDRFAVSIG